MDHWGKMNERRRFRRYRTKNRAFIIFNTTPTKLAEIQDISIDGLSFLYADDEQWLDNSPEINILYSDDEDSYLQEIPTRNVSDRFLEKQVENLWPRRSGLQFGALTPEQRARLVLLIRDNTMEL